jgi:GrpB-like predicted nucleotidyltransferase (UPF0157 family)
MAVIVVAYDPAWPQIFEDLRARIWPAVASFALGIEHVGSTSVPGLAAKPIIDLDVVAETPAMVEQIIGALGGLGYVHRGDLGIKGREAMEAPVGPAHHLYVCLAGSEALRNHLFLRDYLRAHPNLAASYGELKMRLAREFADDIDGYVDGKTDFILEILARSDLTVDGLKRIGEANRKPS